MNLQLFLGSAGVGVGRSCPICHRPTFRVPPRVLSFAAAVFPRYLSSRYCHTCDRRRLHLHVGGSP